jgi:hypothetical protein
MKKQATIPTHALDDAQHNHIAFVDVLRKPVDVPLHRSAGKEDGTRATFGQLCQLPYMEEDEDYTRPTSYAFESALNLLLSARDVLYQSASEFPRASFGTTDKGSVLIYWRKPGRSVQAVVPFQPEGDGYIHVLEGSTPTIYDDLRGSTLAKALDEFIR